MGSLPLNGTNTTTTTTTTTAAAATTASSSSSPHQARHALYLVGQNVTHTIAPPMHDHIATQLLDLPGTWSFTARECPSVEDALALLRGPDLAGGVVTMPYKKTIMPLLDGLDDLCVRIGACNCVYLTPEGTLRGTNTDWRGIKGCLLGASGGSPGGDPSGKGKPALVIGAGGASRAAVYALGLEMGCTRIYVINRDEGEVADLVADVARMAPPESRSRSRSSLEMVHVQSVEQARTLESPHYVVGTVPDFEPQTPQERSARSVLEVFLRAKAEKAVFLDMCFKPRLTRQIKLARKYGWRTVEGTEIIGHQIEEQWRLWTGRVLSASQQEEAWRVLRGEAEGSKAINF
jgi:quinate dehydrogenase